jgi:hypothetical protein
MTNLTLFFLFYFIHFSQQGKAGPLLNLEHLRMISWKESKTVQAVQRFRRPIPQLAVSQE